MKLRIKLDEFRCFRSTDWVDIKPLTVLVGENSTGKTSFLAALRYLVHSLGDRSEASFNQDPYFLGAYDQIAHYRGGSYGRARSFTLGIEFDPTFYSIAKRRPRKSDAENDSRKIRLDFCFRPESGQPALEKTRLELEDSVLNVGFGEKAYVSISVNNKKQLELISPSDDEYLFELEHLSFRGLKYVLSELRYMSSKYHENVRKPTKKERVAVKQSGEIAKVLRMLSNRIGQGVVASAPVRTRPQRTYEPVEEKPTSEGAHIPLVLTRLRSTNPAQWERLKRSLDAFGKSAGLFDDIKIKRLGKSASDPFQILVKISGPASNLIDVGYGVSQALPLVIDLIRVQPRRMFLYQQPEVHLHPSAQAELATFFNVTAQARQHIIVAETHSDHFLDRVRMDVRDERALRPDQVSILYFERNGLDVSIHQLEIDEKGNIIGAPPTYRSFFIREEVRSLGEK